MATAQKSTIRRYNGVDWDPIYLATTADIVALGKAATIEKLTESPFKYNNVLEIGDNIADLLILLVNRLATIDNDVIPGLSQGSSITELDASKITGIISRENLPDDVGGKVVTTQDKDSLVEADVNIGDLVQVVTEDKTVVGTYMVSGFTAGENDGDPKTPNFIPLTDSTSDVDWSRITGAPDTVDGYGITDAVKTTDTVDHGTKTEGDAEDFSAASKVAKTNADGKLDFDITGDAGSVGGKKVSELGLKIDIDAINETIGDTDTEGTLKNLIAVLMEEMKNQDATWIKTGLLDLKVIPKVALSEMHVVTAESDMQNLTTEQVQQGDTVKIADKVDEEGNITEAGKMYYVADETKLGTDDWESAFMPYTAAEASAVQWAGVLNKPTTLVGYGITDAATAKSVEDLANEVKTLRDAVLGTGEGDGEEPGTTLLDRVANIENQIGDAETEGSILNTLEKLKSGEAVEALDATKLTGTVSRENLPVDIGGRLIEVTDLGTAMDTLTSETAAQGDLVKLDNGQVYMVVDATKLGVEEGYKPVVDVSKVTDGLVKTTQVITNGIPTEPVEGEDAPESLAGKIVALGEDQKLHANIAGDAATVGGKSADEFATKEAFDELSLRVPLFLDSLDELTDPKVGQVVLLPVTPTTIVTDLETGESQRMDHMAAAKDYVMTDEKGNTSNVDPAVLRVEDI